MVCQEIDSLPSTKWHTYGYQFPTVDAGEVVCNNFFFACTFLLLARFLL
jgi:hypothetical protein